MLDDIALVRRDRIGTDVDDLFLDGPGSNDRHRRALREGRIERIKFANGIITGTQAANLAREATPEEQTATEGGFFDDERPREETSSP